MDILEFISASEWPIVVGGALWLYRKSLREAMKGLRPTKVTAPGFSAEFVERIAIAEQLTAVAEEKDLQTIPIGSSANQSSEKQKETPADLWPKIGSARRRRNPQSPGAEIIDTFGRLEMVMRAMWGAMHPVSKMPPNIVDVARSLGLGEDHVAALLQVLTLRNQVAHDLDLHPSPSDADRFQQVVADLRDASSAVYQTWREDGGEAKEYPPPPLTPQSPTT